jgi:hypothetical protein
MSRAASASGLGRPDAAGRCRAQILGWWSETPIAWRRGETTQFLRHQAGKVDAGTIVQEGPDNLQPTGEARAREAHRCHRGREVNQATEARPEKLVGDELPPAVDRNGALGPLARMIVRERG